MNKRQENIKYSKMLLVLFFTILFLGIVTYVVVFIFVQVLSIIYPKLKRVLPNIFCKLLRLVLYVQPGIHYQFDIKLPNTNRNILLISNHRSNMDVFSFMAQIPNLRIVANDRLFKIPIFGLLLSLKRQIRVKGSLMDSLDQCIDEMKMGMRKKDNILFFPELTRCNKGFIGTNKFLLTPFSLAIDEDALVVPLVVSKTDYIWPKNTVGLNYNVEFKSYSLDIIDSRDFKTARELANKCKDLIDGALLRDGY